MGKTILFVVLGGLLVLGMSPAFAEDPQLSDQEILKAWGQVKTDVKEVAEVAALERKGLTPMTDENLDTITAAGHFEFDWSIFTNKFDTFALIGKASSPVAGGGEVSCKFLIGSCSNTPKIKVIE